MKIFAQRELPDEPLSEKYSFFFDIPRYASFINEGIKVVQEKQRTSGSPFVDSASFFRDDNTERAEQQKIGSFLLEITTASNCTFEITLNMYIFPE